MSTATASQPNQISEYLKKLREQSNKEHKINRLRRLILDAPKNPNEYKPEEFFPTIPDDVRKKALDSVSESPSPPTRKSTSMIVSNKSASTKVSNKSIHAVQTTFTGSASNPTTPKINRTNKEITELQVTNTSPVSDPIPPSEDEQDKENIIETQKQKSASMPKKSSKADLSEKMKDKSGVLGLRSKNQEHLTPILNASRTNPNLLNRKSVIATPQNQIDDDDLISDVHNNLNKSSIRNIQHLPRLSSTTCESPISTNDSKLHLNNKNIESKKSSNRRSKKNTMIEETLQEEEEQDENYESENIREQANFEKSIKSKNNLSLNTKNVEEILESDEVIAGSNQTNVKVNEKYDAKNSTMKPSKLRQPVIFVNKLNNNKNNQEKEKTIISPDAISFAPSNLSKRNNKTPTSRKSSSNKSKSIRNEEEEETDSDEQESPIEPDQQNSISTRNKRKSQHSIESSIPSQTSSAQSIKSTKNSIDQQKRETDANKNQIDKIEENEDNFIYDIVQSEQQQIGTEIEQLKPSKSPTRQIQNKKVIPSHQEEEIAKSPTPKKVVSKISITKVADNNPKNINSKKQTNKEDSMEIESVNSTNNRKNKKTASDSIKEMPPPPAPPQSVLPPMPDSDQSNKRRRSSRLEASSSTISNTTTNNLTKGAPIRDLDVDIMSAAGAKKRNLTRQISNIGLNDDMMMANDLNNTQDEQELIQSQGNKFIQRSFQKTINQTNNQTVNSTTSTATNIAAASIFKAKNAPPSITSNSKFNSNVQKNLFSSSSQPMSQKQTQSQNVETQDEEEHEEEQQKEHEIKKAKSKNKKAKSKDTVNSNDNSNNKKKQTRKVESDEEEEEKQPDTPVEEIKKSKNRTALKDIKNNKQQEKEKQIKLKTTEAIKKTTSKPKSARFETQRRLSIHPIEKYPEDDFDEQENGLRRSKRVKIDKNSAPVYHFETIKDFQGNEIIVTSLVGTKRREDEWTRYLNKYTEQYKQNVKKRKLAKDENYPSQKNSKKTKRIANRQDLYDDDDEDNNHNNNDNIDFNNHGDLNYEQLNSKKIVISSQNQGTNGDDTSNDNESITISSDLSKINTSQEIVELNYPDQPDSNQILYCFKKLNHLKEFQNCIDGMSISPTSADSGIIKLDAKIRTKTNSHDQKMVFFVQNGDCLFSINNNTSKHTAGDVIKVPKGFKYKIKNLSDNDHLYLYFQFCQEN